jgi:hypothetical protein
MTAPQADILTLWQAAGGSTEGFGPATAEFLEKSQNFNLSTSIDAFTPTNEAFKLLVNQVFAGGSA